MSETSAGLRDLELLFLSEKNDRLVPSAPCLSFLYSYTVYMKQMMSLKWRTQSVN